MHEPIVRESRGVILDEADDWRVVARAFDKFFNYGESGADEIDWGTARVQEKVDGCFRRGQSVCVWGGGVVTMGEIADGARPRLIGMGADGSLVPADILAVKDNGTKDNWIAIGFGERRTVTMARRLVVTDNHHIHINGEFRPASHVKVGDILVEYVKAPCANALHAMRACLLGDGSVSPVSSSHRFTAAHKVTHAEYSQAIRSWLGEFAVSDRIVTSGFGSEITHSSSITTSWLLALREEWYPGGGEKRVPTDLSWIDDFAVAVWLMDDGSRSHNDGQRDRATFSTNGFPKDDVDRLAAHLTEMYGVKCTVFFSKGWCLRVLAGRDNSIARFWDAVAPHVVGRMRYKLPEDWRTVPYVERPAGRLTYARRDLPVASVERLDLADRNTFGSGRRGYDIETTTGNYFAGGVLVHNSLIVLYSYGDRWHVASVCIHK
jgi:hypothetical protein